MTGKPECEKFLDQFIDSTFSEEAGKHLAGCPACRELRETMQSIQSKGSLLEPPPSLLQRKISQSLAARAEASSAIFDLFWSLITGLRQPQFVLAAVFLLALPGVVYYFHSPGMNPVSSQKTSSTLTAPWLSLVSRSEVFNDGKGTIIENIGPAVVRFQPMELDVKSGEIISKIEPGSFPSFKITTPHGFIQVVGTIFTTTVTSSDTVVKVARGKVLVTPKNGLAKIIVVGESAKMVSFSDPKSPATNQILAPDEDVTQNSR